MSATPIPCTVLHYPKIRSPHSMRVRTACSHPNRSRTLSGFDDPGSPARAEVRAGRRAARYCLALDLGRPGLLDQLDHRVGHRDVVELFSHLVALLEGELEELERFLRGGL